ncbi:uncharacterized protein LOC119743521 [Patiria miniata]|uniref:Uncharacterized protein n=1 Tax=Patiria miniata TaxID=46514 RepID=A0A914BJ63_PATMI|nr:uncharacterized protein LOC119743521 [Patiria miniata]
MASLAWLVVARIAVVLPICLWFVLAVSANEKSIPVWTWLDGTTLVNQPSTLTAGSQYPGCRAESGIWTPPTAGVVWMYGGREGSGMALNDLWLYDMPSQEWTNIQRGKEQSWPKPRYGAAVCGVTNSSVVVYGGAQSTENLLSDTWLYHLHNQSWMLLSDSSQPGVRANMVHWCTHDALWIYGVTSSDPNAPQTMWKFSFQSFDWTEVGGDTGNRGSPEEFRDLGRWKTAAWVVKNSHFYILGRNPPLASKSCQGKTSEVKNKCDLWRYSSLSNEWEHISTDAKADSESAGVVEQPSCLASAAFWPDASGNLWLLDSSNGTDSTCEETSQTRSNLWMLDLRLMRWISFQTHNPQSEDVLEWSQDTHSQPPPRAYCASWSRNNTYYLFGGLARNGSVGALNDLWDFQLLEVESLHPSPIHALAVPPVAVFFLSLGALGILSLFVFAVIFFTKCSAGPRLKPPNHFGDKIRYSPVEMDEVLFT